MNYDLLEGAWAAGLFEGEGHIGITNKQSYPRLTVGMTDQDTLFRFSQYIGTKLTRPYRSTYLNSKLIWFTYLGGIKCLTVLLTFFPYLGQRRKDMLNYVLGMWEHSTRNPKWKEPKSERII